MGNQQSVKKINYEDVQYVLENNKKKFIIINTLDVNNQNCLIINTIRVENEEKIINSCIKTREINIVIYGKNSHDESIYKKYSQLYSLGFTNIYIYTGGLFEWLCLQDIFGQDEFPTTTKELDILKYRPPSEFLDQGLIEDLH